MMQVKQQLQRPPSSNCCSGGQVFGAVSHFFGNLAQNLGQSNGSSGTNVVAKTTTKNVLTKNSRSILQFLFMFNILSNFTLKQKVNNKNYG